MWSGCQAEKITRRGNLGSREEEEREDGEWRRRSRGQGPVTQPATD